MHALRLSTLAFLSLVTVAGVPQGSQSSPAIQVSGDLCTGGTANGTGLRAAYYNGDPQTTKPVLVQLEPKVDSGAVVASRRRLAANAFQTVRWCGWIRPTVSGPHRFSAAAKGLRVDINKQTVTNSETGKSSPFQMRAGEPYAILIEIQDAGKADEFTLQWTPPFGVTYDIPPSVLFPPIATVNPGC